MARKGRCTLPSSRNFTDSIGFDGYDGVSAAIMRNESKWRGAELFNVRVKIVGFSLETVMWIGGGILDVDTWKGQW